MTVVVNRQNWNIEAVSGTIENAPQKALMIGQQGLTATATPNEIVENIGNSGQEDTLFDRKSMLATMCRTFKRYNKISQLDALPLADPSVGPS
jgi:phage tail sheath gpL-like